MTPTRALLTAAIVLGLFSSAAGQNLLLGWSGSTPGQRLGVAVARAGDVNGDGRSDVLVGSVGAFGLPGQVHLLSGADGAPLLILTGTVVGDGFGMAVGSVGDLNGDAVPDLAVGAPLASSGGPASGHLYVFSGTDGTLLHSIPGSHAGDHLGESLAGLGDVSGDGVPDIAVGAPFADDAGNNSGSVRVLSGADATLVLQVAGPRPFARFGHALAAAGDLDGDGAQDLVVGAPYDSLAGSGAGSAWAVSTSTGTSLLPGWFGSGASDHFGAAVAGIGDLTGDGVPEIAVGAPDALLGSLRPGRVLVFSGNDGALLQVHEGDQDRDAFGISVAGPGDVDGDGVPDLLVGANQRAFLGFGYARLHSGADGTARFTVAGSGLGDLFGQAVGGAGDCDGDGVPEVVVGAPQYIGYGMALWPGYARVYSLPAPVSNTLSQVTADPSTISAYAGQSTITVLPRRPDGSVFGPGLQVVVQSTAGTLLGSVADLGDGRYLQILEGSPEASGAMVTARVNGIPLVATAAVAFIAVDPAASTVDVDPATVMVGGRARARVIPRDRQGSPIGPGLQVQVASSAGLLIGPVVDEGDGSYTQIIEGTVAATALVSAAVDGAPLRDTATLNIIDTGSLGAVIGFDPAGGLHAFPSIQTAVDRASEIPLHTILVDSGIYEEVVLLKDVSGLVLEAMAGSGVPVIRGLRFSRCHDVTVRGFEVEPGLPASEGVVLGPDGLASTRVRLEDCHLHGSHGSHPGLRVGRGNAEITVLGGVVEECGGSGLVFEGPGGDHQVLSVVVRHNRWNGIQVDADTCLLVSGCDISGNGTAPGDGGGRYGLLRQRVPGSGQPTLVTLVENFFSGNQGKVVPGRSDHELGNYDQIIDSTDLQPGYAP